MEDGGGEAAGYGVPGMGLNPPEGQKKQIKSYTRLTLWTSCADCFVAFCPQLSDSVTEISVPFDATSETPLEEQRTEAMVRVQDALFARLGPEALGLLRAARSGFTAAQH